ncbi:hypothetical protein [Cloacibacillus evryensis]|uniref:hypothetical protein n=1 Tax=Cloacibacillus evryensis TaxID=508460 RepID=UPI0026718837|nr:hypothetical protein [Cloacibacillus evryensis]
MIKKMINCDLSRHAGFDQASGGLGFASQAKNKNLKPPAPGASPWRRWIGDGAQKQKKSYLTDIPW